MPAGAPRHGLLHEIHQRQRHQRGADHDTAEPVVMQQRASSVRAILRRTKRYAHVLALIPHPLDRGSMRLEYAGARVDVLARKSSPQNYRDEELFSVVGTLGVFSLALRARQLRCRLRPVE
jgi:hypothetical protein